jgi:hypothetical protein
MNKISALIVAMLLAAALKGQDCTSVYLPLKKDAQLEYKQYDKSDKVVGSTTQKIKDLKSSASSTEATVEAEHFDAKGVSTGKGDIVLRCENGVFYLDMQNYLQGMGNMSSEDMQIIIEGGKLALPSSLKTGDMLANGDMTMTMSAGGVKVMTVAVTISNRKVEAQEKLTTPAGTFDCYKITYDLTTKMMGTQQVKGVEWYAKNVGLIKQETYDSKGKLAGYMLLTALK